MNKNNYNKFLKYKQKYLNFKEQIGDIINQYGGAMTCLFICTQNISVDTMFILEYLRLSHDNIIYIPIKNLTVNYINLNKKKFKFVVFQDCDNINQDISSIIHKLLEIGGILYISTSKKEQIDQFNQYIIKDAFTTFYIPSTIINKHNLAPEDASSLAYLLNTYIKHNKDFELLKSSGAVLPVITSEDEEYFEWQQSMGCGRHALNNLFGKLLFIQPEFIKEDPYTYDELLKIGIEVETVKMNLNRLCEYYQIYNSQIETDRERYDIDVMLCDSTENYHSSIMVAALNICGYECHSINNNVFKILDKYTQLSDYIGFIISYPGHWVSLRKTQTGYIYYDSMDKPQIFITIADYCYEHDYRIRHIFIVFKRLHQIDNFNTIHVAKNIDIMTIGQLAEHKLLLQTQLKEKSNSKITDDAIRYILKIADIDTLILFSEKIKNMHTLSDKLIGEINNLFNLFDKRTTVKVIYLKSFIESIAPSDIDTDLSTEEGKSISFGEIKKELIQVLKENNISDQAIYFITQNIESHEIADKFINKIIYHDKQKFKLSSIDNLQYITHDKSNELTKFINKIELMSPLLLLDNLEKRKHFINNKILTIKIKKIIDESPDLYDKLSVKLSKLHSGIINLGKIPDYIKLQIEKLNSLDVDSTTEEDIIEYINYVDPA